MIYERLPPRRQDRRLRRTTRDDLQDALDTIEPDFDTDYPDFREAVEAGVSATTTAAADDDGDATPTATATATASPTATPPPDDGRSRRPTTTAPPTTVRATTAGALPPDDGTLPPEGDGDPSPTPAPVPTPSPPTPGPTVAARRAPRSRRPRRDRRRRPTAACWRPGSCSAWLRLQLLARSRSSSSGRRSPAWRRPRSAPAQRGRISPTGCASGDDGLTPHRERAFYGLAVPAPRYNFLCKRRIFAPSVVPRRAGCVPSGPRCIIHRPQELKVPCRGRWKAPWKRRRRKPRSRSRTRARRGAERAAAVHAAWRAPVRRGGVGAPHRRRRLVPAGGRRVPEVVVAELDQHRRPEVLPRPAELADARALGQADDHPRLGHDRRLGS